MDVKISRFGYPVKIVDKNNFKVKRIWGVSSVGFPVYREPKCQQKKSAAKKGNVRTSKDKF